MQYMDLIADQPCYLTLYLATFRPTLQPYAPPCNRTPHLATLQVLGVGIKALGPMYAELLRLRGRTGMVVHSSDGLDEISIEAHTDVWEVTTEGLKEYQITPADFGVETHKV